MTPLDQMLCEAAEGGDVAEVSRLLGMGADPRQKWSHGSTPLMLACSAGRVEAARLLWALPGGDATDNKGRSAYSRAREAGHGALASELLAALPGLARGPLAKLALRRCVGGAEGAAVDLQGLRELAGAMFLEDWQAWGLGEPPYDRRTVERSLGLPAWVDVPPEAAEEMARQLPAIRARHEARALEAASDPAARSGMAVRRRAI